MIYYSLLAKRLCFASTNLISHFSTIYFLRTHFRGLGNIVGFTNSRKSARNYSPVRKSMDRIAESNGKTHFVAFYPSTPLRNRKYYSLLAKQNAFASPLLRLCFAFASPPLISFHFSSIYFGRTHFRGLGNIVGFGNSPNSPRNYSPVMKFIYRMHEWSRFGNFLALAPLAPIILSIT